MKMIEENDKKLLDREASYARTYSFSRILMWLFIVALFVFVFSGQVIDDRILDATLITTALWFAVFQYSKAKLQHIESIRHYLNKYDQSN